jgi:hypothetical protein
MRNGPEEKRPPHLLSGYYLDETTDPDAVILRREDGSEVVVFGERVVTEEWNGRRGRTGGGAATGDG